MYLKNFDFVEVDYVEMWELMLCVFIKKNEFNYLHSRSSNYIALGVLGLVGNKGGLCL